MPGGGRRLPRTVRSSLPTAVTLIPGDMTSSRYSALGATVPTLPGLETPISPKHFPFPTTPTENDLVFESIMFFYTIMVASLQFLHLYRTVWWLPHSYTNYAVNFYLIDINLVIFILIILLRRLIYIVGCWILEAIIPNKFLETCFLSYRVLLFKVTFSTLVWCAYYVIQTHPFLNILYLCYPILVYIILFGFNITPFFDLISWNNGTIPPLHACSSNAVDIRLEVENLKTSFNNRMKHILFSSILNAYYAGFIPCCFAQNFLHYDIYWATQHVIFIFLGCFSSYTNHILPLRYCDTLHRSALHLGSWERVETRSILPVAYTWQEDMLWPQGILVRFGREMYRAHGDSNAAEPGNTTYSRFYSIFKNPSVALSGLLALQVLLVLFQLCLLIRCTYWYHIVSLSLLLCFNYFTLFKIARDYLICLKIYKAEQTLHEKAFLN